MKIVGILLIIGILLSYVPVTPMDDCPESNHEGNANTKMDCGHVFHCPLILSGGLQEPLSLPLSGWLMLPPILPKVDELTHLIFHPPKAQTIYSISEGMKEFPSRGYDFGTRIAFVKVLVHNEFRI